MRILGALKADLNFQLKQGFYAVYAFVTVFYIVVLRFLPDAIVSTAVPLIILSDPSILGFFFIGAIVMLEKTQGILQYLVVTPLRSREYLLSKVISLSILAETAGITVAIFAYKGSVNWFLLCVSILLTSVFFTFYGFVAAAGCHTMNQYFTRMIPYILLIVLPCFSILIPDYNTLFNIFPSVSALKLVYAAFHPISYMEILFCLIFLLSADILMLFIVERIFDNKIVCEGEGV